ncbi:Protein of unknown function [Bacillus cereus]|nr:Protein of unknown function [Bacillus cereus]SCN05980.1 Protein of unknown function [Bacillus wiedmannii]SCV23074.1 Protein of unknown function [Bacillus cereus]
MEEIAHILLTNIDT